MIELRPGARRQDPRPSARRSAFIARTTRAASVARVVRVLFARAALVMFALAASRLAIAAEGALPWTIGGSVLSRTHSAYLEAGPIDASDFSFGSASVLALDFRARGDKARAEASIEASALSGQAARATWAAAASGGAGDLLLAPSPSGPSEAASPPPALLAARLRALYVKLDLDWASLSAGRQVVNYGRGILWSPIDLFADPDYSGLSLVRRGVDVLRLKAPLGATGALDLVAAPKEKPEDGRYALRLSGMLSDVDLALIAAREGGRGGTWTGGADFKADLGIGLYGEAVFNLSDVGTGLEYRCAMGADWSFEDFILAAEYYRYDGQPDPAFPGGDNAFASLAWSATDFVKLSGSLIWEIAEKRLRSTAILGWDAAQNASASLYLRATRGFSGVGAWAADAGFSIEVKF